MLDIPLQSLLDICSGLQKPDHQTIHLCASNVEIGVTSKWWRSNNPNKAHLCCSYCDSNLGHCSSSIAKFSLKCLNVRLISGSSVTKRDPWLLYWAYTVVNLQRTNTANVIYDIIITWWIPTNGNLKISLPSNCAKILMLPKWNPPVEIKWPFRLGVLNRNLLSKLCYDVSNKN